MSEGPYTVGSYVKITEDYPYGAQLTTGDVVKIIHFEAPDTLYVLELAEVDESAYWYIVPKNCVPTHYSEVKWWV